MSTKLIIRRRKIWFKEKLICALFQDNLMIGSYEPLRTFMCACKLNADDWVSTFSGNNIWIERTTLGLVMIPGFYESSGSYERLKVSSHYEIKLLGIKEFSLTDGMAFILETPFFRFNI